MAKKKDTGRTMRPGGEDDLRVPAHKRKNSYGESIINGRYAEFTQSVNADRRAQKDFADEVDKGNPTLDAGHRDAARMHVRSLDGHATQTARSLAEIARRLYKRGQNK